jgi:hypothetical protein
MKFSLLVIVAIAVSLIACDDAERAKADNKQFAELGVSHSLWMEIDPPPNMPDGTRCYVWYWRCKKMEYFNCKIIK